MSLEFFTDPTLLPFAIGGLLIGIWGVVFGGSMFLSVPFVQILFPGISFGQIVGNIKVGSLFRGIGSTWSTRKHIDWKDCFFYSIPLLIGTVVGVSIISQLSQKWILPAIIFAIILSEAAPYTAKFITKKTFYLSSVITGIYAGFLGAGIGVLLVALFRLKHPEDTQISHVKTQARFIEWLLVFVAVFAHIVTGNIILKIWLVWATGSLIGGFIGGHILNSIGTLSGRIQKVILRTSFVFALVVAIVKFIA